MAYDIGCILIKKKCENSSSNKSFDRHNDITSKKEKKNKFFVNSIQN
jgi:hypothetical protein